MIVYRLIHNVLVSLFLIKKFLLIRHNRFATWQFSFSRCHFKLVYSKLVCVQFNSMPKTKKYCLSFASYFKDFNKLVNIMVCSNFKENFSREASKKVIQVYKEKKYIQEKEIKMLLNYLRTFTKINTQQFSNKQRGMREFIFLLH